MKKGISLLLLIFLLVFGIHAYSQGKDEKGTVHASSDHSPESKDSVKARKESPTPVKHTDNAYPTWTATGTPNETPVIIKNKQIFVPIVIGHKGQLVKTTILLDPERSETLLHHKLACADCQRSDRGIRATVDRNSQVYTLICMVDFLQVGPHREANFKITTRHTQKKEGNKYRGWLGMNFLKKHPFRIDYKRKVIKWL